MAMESRLSRTGRAIVLAAVAAVLLNAQQQKRAEDQTVMDDPLAEQRLNREIWESVKDTPYSEALKYVEKAQAAVTAAPATVRLPTGWTIAPAGKQIPVGTLPFDAVYFAGSIVVVNSGFSRGPQSLSIVNPKTGTVERTIPVQTVFPAVAAGASSLYVSGGEDGKVYQYDKDFHLVNTYVVPGFVSGISEFAPDQLAVSYSQLPVVIAVAREGRVAILNTTTGNVVADAKVSSFEPYSIRAGQGKLYVTIPQANQVVVLDEQLRTIKTVTVGRTPQTMCDSGPWLYVVNSNSDEVSVISTDSDEVARTFRVRFHKERHGTAPTSCAIDGTRLYVSLAGPNAVAVLNRLTGVAEGLIPTGWYPTRVLVTGEQIATLSAKGIQPRRPNSGGEFVLMLLNGTVGLLDRKDIAPNLANWTKRVALSTPLSALFNTAASRTINHIFYIVKENRTYDQVLGDLELANGDPALTLFGRQVTPIQHYLADEFVTLDNFFVTGEVSTIGHSYTASGYASPYLQMLTSMEYSDRFDASSNTVPAAISPVYLWDAMKSAGVTYRIYGEYIYFSTLYEIIFRHFGPGSELAAKTQYLSSRGEKLSKAYEPLSLLLLRNAPRDTSPKSIQALLRLPGFGQAFSRFFTGDEGLYKAMAGNEGFLQELAFFLSKYAFQFRSFDLSYSDLDRAATWVQEFQARDAAGTVEQFHYILLPNDHTSGSSGALTPPQFVAQNDAAVDIVLRALSRSNIWSQSLVLIVEDDAQNGLDHVDATRTTAYAVGPRVKRKTVVSDVYDQVSMVRTIGWLLGLEPLSMNDAVAIPMWGILKPAGEASALKYDPPPVSTQLTAKDKQRYDEIIATYGLGRR